LISWEGDGLARLSFPESDPRYLRYRRFSYRTYSRTHFIF
jgi:hypothetical protein